MALLKATEKGISLYLYDEIGIFGIEASAVVSALNEQDDSLPLSVYINSPGGSVFDGLAIYNYLARWPGGVAVHIDGLAASIASVIAMAGEEVYATEGSMMMIHNAWTIGMGNSSEFEKLSQDLAKMDSTIAGVYAKKTGLALDKIKKLMAKETWFDADEGLENGFFDKKKEEKAQLLAFDLASFGFKNVPKALKKALEEVEKSAFSIRKAEKDLREAGWSRKDAKAIVSKGFSVLKDESEAERDALTEEESNFIHSLFS